MSQRNQPQIKAGRRAQRVTQKLAAARRMRHCGVLYTPQIVRGQRYLRNAGLPFSRRIANLTVREDTSTLGNYQE